MTKVSLHIEYLREGDIIVVDCPSLGVSSYGSTLEEAHQNFKDALAAFLRETKAHGTLEQVLKERGWTKSETPPRHWAPPAIIKQEYEDVLLPA